ncbi:hypothetical protein GQ457_14G026730 [Hibiscus cannabinus]
MLTSILDPQQSKEDIDVSTSSSAHVADPEVLPRGPVTRSNVKQFKEIEEHELGDLSLVWLKLRGLYAARFSSTNLTHLQLAHFSSSKLRSALLAQFKLNNLEVAETYPTQGRVSYGHVDSMWGILPFLYACARHVMASGACAMHTGQHVQRMYIITHAKHVAGCFKASLHPFWRLEFAYNIPRSVTFEETTFRQVTSYHIDVSTTMPAKVADLEVLPLGPISRSRAQKFREVLSLTYTKKLDSFDDVSALDNKLFNVLYTDV